MTTAAHLDKTRLAAKVRDLRVTLLDGGFEHSGAAGQLSRRRGSEVLFVRTDLERGKYVVTVFTRENGKTGRPVGTHRLVASHKIDLERVAAALVNWDGTSTWPPHRSFRADLREV